MFSAKCVNPDCLADFDHRRGRIFRFHQRLGGDAFEDTCTVLHFWLCDHCSQTYALEYVQGTAVLVGCNGSVHLNQLRVCHRNLTSTH
jgi:hypothetical protein